MLLPPLPTAPSAPTALEATAVSSSEIFVQWAPPDNPRGIITEYLVTYHPTEAPMDLRNQSTMELSVNLTSLTPFTEYNINVAAITVAIGPLVAVTETTLQAGLS